MNTVTQWLSPDDSPAHIGVYEMEPDLGSVWFSYWDGAKWMWHDSTIYKAFKNRHRETGASPSKWRGLAEKPKGK